MTALIEAVDVSRHFELAGGGWTRAKPRVTAVDHVSLAIEPGEVVGLVGESGSGKTTIGNMLLRFDSPSAGSIRFEGQDITRLSERRLRAFRRQDQPIFQDPYGSLNPRMTAEEIVGEPLIVHKLAAGRQARRDRVVELLSLVGLGADHLARHPHQFSGGQRQRIGIARALAISPRLIIADEPVAALDVSIQAQVVNLLKELQAKFDLAMLFIAHDLAVVRYLSSRIV
ncbi:MAG: ATP-binding cassette domain-containing protein, partial [Steroidobacteraceae bacterium]